MEKLPLAPAQSWLNNQDPQLPRMLGFTEGHSLHLLHQSSQVQPKARLAGEFEPNSISPLASAAAAWAQRPGCHIERENPLISWPPLPYEYPHKWDCIGTKMEWKTRELDSLGKMHVSFFFKGQNHCM